MLRPALIRAAWVLAVVAATQATAYQEAPMLAERVARGELPPVGQRLPDNPAVVEPVDAIGAYGGTWRRLAASTNDLLLTTRMGYEPLVRWDRTGKQVVPGLAKSWEVRDGGRTYVFQLRKGLKWSDGHPLTSADFVFYREDILGNEDISPVFPDWLTVGRRPVEVAAPDAHTVVYRFAAPYGIFLEMLAFKGSILAPKHYLKQYVPPHTPMAELERRARDRDYDFWTGPYHQAADYNLNPDLPTWRPFKIATRSNTIRAVAERNPFYWKADPAGNQLPYIDRVSYELVPGSEVVTMKAMSGGVDFQARRIDASDYPVFMENREKGGYRVLRDLNPGTVVLHLNQNSKDPAMRRLLRDRRFRIALSVAIDRAELIAILYSGMAAPSRGLASEHDPYYLPEFDAKYLDFDPDHANALLDELGLGRGSDGIRRLPDGRPFRRVLNVFPSESGTTLDLWQLVADYFREVGLDFAIKTDAHSLSYLQVNAGNSDFWAYATAGLHWVLDPHWYVPVNAHSYFAPLYGRHVASNGTDKLGVPPTPEFARILDWYRELCAVVDEPRRKLALGRNILRQWAEECYTIGIVRQELLTIVSNRFHNVPGRIIHDWRIATPGYIGIEQFYIKDAR